jgi:hypothetical protein
MKLSDLVERLIEIQNSYPDNPEVSIMTESRKLAIQIQEPVTDVAYSSRSGVIIIGYEDE